MNAESYSSFSFGEYWVTFVIISNSEQCCSEVRQQSVKTKGFFSDMTGKNFLNLPFNHWYYNIFFFKSEQAL